MIDHKIKDATQILLLTILTNSYYHNNQQMAKTNEKVSKCLKAYKKLRHKSTSCKKFLRKLKKLKRLEHTHEDNDKDKEINQIFEEMNI